MERRTLFRRIGKTIRGHEIKYYVQLLQSVREESLKYLGEQGDEWLMSERKWLNGVAHNQYYLWFHVLEDEMSHRGQIRMIKINYSKIKLNKVAFVWIFHIMRVIKMRTG